MALSDVQEAIAAVATRIGPATVGIGRAWGGGSGVVIGEGQVLTSAHNLRGDEATVTFEDGRQETGRVAGIDTDEDVAVVAVDTGDVPPVTWAEETPGIGAAVVALANPGGRGLRVTFGFVSGAERSYRGPHGRRLSGGVEHTAPLARGSSGGPLVDAQGRLLGINTLRLGDGFYLALAAEEGLRGRVEALAAGRSVTRPRLGIAVAPAWLAARLRRAVGLSDRDGLLVREVEEGSPAADAGMEKGDLIAGAMGQAIADVDDLHAALDSLEAGSTLELSVIRAEEERRVDVRVPEPASS